MTEQSFHGLPSSSRRWCARAISAGAVGLLLALGGCSHGHAAAPAPAPADAARDVTLSKAQLQHIHVATVTTSTYHRAIDVNGVVDFDNDQATAVLAPFSGPVARLLVSVGDHVRKGQALAIVTSPDFADAISAYRKAQAGARTARRVADHDQDLLQHQGISAREAEQAATDATAAEADRDAAMQALQSLQVDPATLAAVRAGRSVAHVSGIIRAPISGTVVDRLITPGQLLQAGGTPCFTIADLSRVWVQAQIFGADIDAIRVGDPAVVDSGIDGRHLPGTLTTIGASVDADSRSVTARVVVDNPQGLLKKQMYVRVHIQSRQDHKGVLVPVSAILRDDVNLPFVYVVQADGGFARRSVRLGDRLGKRRDITHGLHDGERIVVDGALFVQFMQNQ